MSKQLLTPNYCSCTVNQARNLPDKGKHGGINAFCTMSMGKEKFATAVCEKTTAPNWHEQCDMPIVDDATIKLTVYHENKSALSKGDFVGRAYVSLRDLQDYDRVHTNWYKLTNKDGKFDKERGEIEVTLQFYSKNNTTGSVLDLSTSKKHPSLKDIKHSLSARLKSASKHRKQDKYGGDNQLATQRNGFGGGENSTYNVRDFLDDSTSDTTSFGGSHMSLNSMSYNNNNDHHKKKSRAPNNGFGPTLGNGTPHSSRRSITSDYETSSILDSASMYGGDEISTPSPPIRSQVQQQQQQQQREVYVGDDLPPKHTSNKKTTKESVSTEHNRNSSIRNDNIDNSSNDRRTSISDSYSGLSTIKENLDTNENIHHSTSSKYQDDEEINFDNYFNKTKQINTEKKPKRTAPIIPSVQELKHSTSQSDSIKTPSTQITMDFDAIPPTSTNNQSQDAKDDSSDEDVNELLGKLERMSSMRSSVRRKIQPKDDPMQISFSETDNKFTNGFYQTPPNRSNNTALPDIVGPQQPTPNSSQRSTSSGSKKPVNNGLSVLGYDNVKSNPVNPKIRQELDYLDREELLHVISHQADVIKKRDIRVKDLEHYTDGLLVKIVEQCPAILQVGSSSRR